MIGSHRPKVGNGIWDGLLGPSTAALVFEIRYLY